MNARILWIDDLSSSESRASKVDCLNFRGFAVDLANELESGLAHAKHRRPDIVLLDSAFVNVPVELARRTNGGRFAGLEYFQAITEIVGLHRVIILSALPCDEIRVQLAQKKSEFGASARIWQLPMSASDLAEEIDRLLERKG